LTKHISNCLEKLDNYKKGLPMQFSEQEFSEIVQVFESEIQDNISNINSLLLILEKDNNDPYAVQELFREAHSIKGAARMVGFTDIQNLAHSFENVMTLKKNNEIDITPEIVETLFNAIDYMEITIGEIIKSKGDYKSDELTSVIEKLESIKNKPNQPETLANDVEFIQLAEDLTVEKKDSDNIDDLMDGLFGEQEAGIKIQEIIAKLKKMKKSSSPKLYTGLLVLLEKIQKVKYQPDDDLIKEIQKAYSIIKDISKGLEIPAEEVSMLEKRLLILHEIVGLAKPETVDDMIANLAENSSQKTLRVEASKLDRLIKQVSELINAKFKNQEHLKEIEKVSDSLQNLQKQWSKSKYQIGRKEKNFEKMYKSLNNASEDAIYMIADVVEQINELHRIVQDDDAKLSMIVGDLENIIKGIRMLPFATIFHMFPRMVKDLGIEQGKQVELTLIGSETKADKKVIDELRVPLIHILRNSVDHGIESPDERLEKGKNPTGKITLKTRYENNHIILEIIDDGRGIDIAHIKRKVLEKGLLTKPELDVMTQKQIMNIIFWPGFSTQEEVTEISGRGVGLDVVHNKISQLNGNVYLDSELGNGLTITIKIPVSMSTSNALIVDIGGQKLAIGTNVISNVKKIDTSKVFLNEGRKNTIINGKTIPVFDLATLLEMPNKEGVNSSKLTLIVLRDDDREVAFVVDSLVGEQEILQKTLAAPLMQIKSLSGLTTLASGEICLILNAYELINTAFSSKQLSLNSAKGQERYNPSDYSILVVEDSHTTRTLQRNILINSGYNVDTSQSAEIAMTKILKKKYDLIISDIEMPGMSGFELFEKINAEVENGKDIKKAIISFLDTDEVKKQADKIGINAFMSKGTFSQDAFLGVIKQILGE
jgi:two-component system chemotaxis sensor kinase CheA